MKRIAILAVLLLLVLASACAPKPSVEELYTDDTPAAETTQASMQQVTETEASTEAVAQPTETSEATAESQANPQETSEPTIQKTPIDKNVVSRGLLNLLSSYRNRLEMHLTVEGADSQDTTLDTAQTTSPQVKRTLMVSKEGDNSTSVDTIQVGTTQYINFGEGWMTSQVSQEEADAFIDTGLTSFYDVAPSLPQEAYVEIGSETVNGVATKHYRVELLPEEAAVIAVGVSDITTVQAEAWLADSPDLPRIVMRFTMTLNGKVDGSAAKFTMLEETSDVNVNFKIEIPAEALSNGLPDDVPAYNNPQELTTMEGFISYYVLPDVATLLTFYDTQLPTKGWEKVDQTDLDPMKMVTYSKGDKILTLTLTPREEGGTDVLITIEVQ